MQIRHAEERDRATLSELWASCFPGDEAFRDYYFDEIFEPGNSFIYVDGDRAVSMAHVISMEFNYHSHILPVGYIFAVGTDPEHRGRGLAGKVLEHILAELRQRNIPLAVLVPHNDNMFDYYRRFGFADVFSVSHEKLRRDAISSDMISGRFSFEICSMISRSLELSDTTQLPKLSNTSKPGASSLTPENIFAANNIYEEVMRHRDHLMRTPVHWERAIKKAEITGGNAFLLKDGERLMAYAICEIVESGLLINELLAEDEMSYHTLCANVLDSMQVTEAVMLTAGCPHGARRFGMARVIDAERMLAYAAEYRKNMECAIEIVDKACQWNTGRYEINGLSVCRVESTGSRAYITPEQLTDVLFGAGPIPYINLLFS